MGLAPGSSAAALWDLMQPRLMSPLLRAADAPRAHSEVVRVWVRVRVRVRVREPRCCLRRAAKAPRPPPVARPLRVLGMGC